MSKQFNIKYCIENVNLNVYFFKKHCLSVILDI